MPLCYRQLRVIIRVEIILLLVKTANLSDLFRKDMYMTNHDSRQRTFITLDELQKRGFDLESAIEQDQKVVLTLGYKFTFNNKQEEIKVQQYFWDKNNTQNRWTIL